MHKRRQWLLRPALLLLTAAFQSVLFAPATSYADGRSAEAAKAGEESPLRIATNPHKRNDVRVQAVESLSQSTFAECGPTLVSLLNKTQPLSVQLAAISTLDHFREAQVGPEMAKRWESLLPDVQGAVLPALLRYADRSTALLEAIKGGTIPSSVLSGAEMDFLRGHKEESVRLLAAAILPVCNPGGRQKVIDAFQPALKLKGFITHGATLFEERCSACHLVRGEGFALGPDLALAKTNGVEFLLTSILDPSREIRPEYVSYAIETTDDEHLVGLIRNETATTLTVRQPNGRQAVLKLSNIRSKRAQKQSLMPDGLEEGLTPQDMADILACISVAQPGGR